ncbi:MAG: hypothetical protein SGARI_007883, partial [Bacillariaceae sp.]
SDISVTAYPSDEPSAYPSDEPSAPTDSGFDDLIGTGIPELLASEEFTNGLGIFSNFGDKVSSDKEDNVDVALFELKKEAAEAPRINTVVSLNGQTIISIFFWFKALYMEVDQTIVVRYSINDRQSWTIVKEIQVDAGQYSFGQWYKVTDILFSVPD